MVFHKAVNTKELSDFERLIALYFYNNSNYVAILLPKSIYNRQKPSKIRFFHGCEIIPTRSAKPRLKQFCIRGLAWAIGIIQIIQEL